MLSLLEAAGSRVVTSNQPAVHRDLTAVVRKHKKFPYRRPMAAHSRTQFARLDSCVCAHGGPLILDSGCGNGEYTRSLARSHPDHLVIGIDKSRVRCARAATPESLENLLIVRGDCVDLWRLAHHAQWPVERHYLLYPNPWPKAKHLRRRWHGHPVFSTLVALGGFFELRSNWEIYVAEFALALESFDTASADIGRLTPEQPMTSFERKYLRSGHPLYRLSIRFQ